MIWRNQDISRGGLGLKRFIAGWLLFTVVSGVSIVDAAKSEDTGLGFIAAGMTDPAVQQSASEIAGTRWIKAFGYDWEHFEPDPPVQGNHLYTWEKMDQLVRKIQDSTPEYLKVVIVIHPMCKWASNPGEFGRIKSLLKKAAKPKLPPSPENIVHWQTFMEHLLERYDFDGIEDMPGLKRPFNYWQIGNEYANGNLWKGTAEQYVAVLKAAYQAKQNANPGAKIIITGLIHLDAVARYDEKRFADLPLRQRALSYVEHNADFSKTILQRPEYFDIVDFHVFTHFRYNPFGIQDAVQWLRNILGDNFNRKTIAVTEWTSAMTWFDYPDKKTLNNYLKQGETLLAGSGAGYDKINSAFEAEQARDIVKVWTTMLAQGVSFNIYVQIRDFSEFKNKLWDKYGLLRAKNRSDKSLQPKPAYYTLKLLAGMIDGFDSVETLSLPPDFFGYKFNNKGKEIFVLWKEGAPGPLDVRQLNLPSGLVSLVHIITDQNQTVPKREKIEIGRTVRQLPLTDTPVILTSIYGTGE